MSRKILAVISLAGWLVVMATVSAQDKQAAPNLPVNQAKPEEQTSPPAKPGNAQESNLDKLEARLEKLQSELVQLNKTVAELKQQLAVLGQGLSTLDKSVDELKKDVTAVNTVLQQQMFAKRLDDLQKELAQLREAFKQETERLHTAIGQVSKTEVRKAFAAPLATGQIIIRNDWTLPVTVSLDGIAYTLQPGQEQRIVRAAGTFTYEVHGWQLPRSRSLAGGEQFLIRIALP